MVRNKGGRERLLPGDRPPVSRALLLAFCTAVALLPPAGAQTGPSIVIKPWLEEPHWADTFDDILVFGKTETVEAGEDARVFYWDSRGRIKFDKADGDPAYGVLGYKVITLDNSSANDVVSGQLNDIALSTPVRLPELIEGWRIDLIGGAGTANDGHFDGRSSWYGIGALDASAPLGGSGRLHVGVEYDGNRALWPDLPLPYVAWCDAAGGRLRYTVGLPESALWWKPVGGFIIDLKYLFPAKADAVAEYELFAGSAFLRGVRLFALYSRAVEGYFMAEPNRRRLDLGRERRFFHELDRVGAGVRLITTILDISLGVGYSFNHRFKTGWDLRELETYRELEDEWIVSLRMQGTF